MAADPTEDDEAYISAEDEDFNPEVDHGISESSDDEEDAPRPDARGAKRQRKDNAEDLDFDNSGDEATIQKAKRKKRKGADNGGLANDDDEGGDGGLVKTRAQRQAEALQAREAPQLKSSSVDVNALWAQMAGGSNKSAPTDGKADEASSHGSQMQQSNGTEEPSTGNSNDPATSTADAGPSTNSMAESVTITRTYDFAGETITEKRTVPKDSAEAKLYLAQQEQAAAAKAAAPEPTRDKNSRPPVRRPVRKSLIPGGGEGDAPSTKAKKLNTVEKSRLDWAKLVDEEGLGEELDGHRKAKDTYLGRMDFLDRMSARDDETRRGGK